MLNSTRKQFSPIGVDVGFNSIRMIQLVCANTPAGRALRVAAAIQIPIAGSAADANADTPERRVEQISEAIRVGLRAGAFTGRRAVAALPREIVHLKNLRLPPMPDADLVWAVRADARDIFGFDPDTARVQFLDAGEVRQGGEPRREVIVIAAGDKLIDHHTALLHRAGLIVEAIDVEPCAAYRAACGTGQEVNVVVEIGARRSQVIIGRGSRVRVLKEIETGSTQLQQAVSRKLGISLEEAGQLRQRLAGAAETPETKRDPVRRAAADATRSAVESLAASVGQCVRYHAVAFRGPGPRRVLLVGGEANDTQLRAALTQALGLPVEPAALFAGMDTSAAPSIQSSVNPGEWAVAFGLALKRMPLPEQAPHAEPAHARASTIASSPVEVIDQPMNAANTEASHV